MSAASRPPPASSLFFDDGALPRIHETSAPDETFVRLWITRPDGEGFRIEADPAISTAEQPSGVERLRMMAGMDA